MTANMFLLMSHVQSPYPECNLTIYTGYWMCTNRSNTADSTCGTWSSHSSEKPEKTQVFGVVRVAQFLVFKAVICVFSSRLHLSSNLKETDFPC